MSIRIPARPFTRRTLIAGMAGSAALIGVTRRAAGMGRANPFTLGVASGEPTPDGMVLWTRLAPEPLAGDGGMPAVGVPVRWEISETPDFAVLAGHGTALAEPDWGHSVHVEVGGLRPDRPYWYRFIASGEASPVGRTRTTPAPGRMADRLRLCFGSCQKYEAGHYAAHRHIASEEPDLILFLGDYIYEGNPAPGDVRVHLNPEPKDVPGYRVRYATYRLDPLLQASHQIAPWSVIWDDHEVANDYANDLDGHNSDPATFLKRRAAAYQVYWEHMPLRRSARPQGPAMHLYRSLKWGQLAEFQLVDDRQYRSPRPCQPPELVAEHKDYRGLTPDCAERHDPARSILGAEQEAWLRAAFEASPARWNVLAQQTLMCAFPRIDPWNPDSPSDVFSLDTWEGYPAARERILRHWRDAKIANPVIFSGDIHAFVATDHMDPDDPKAPAIATEFVGGSITSHNHDALFHRNTRRLPGYRFGENQVRGYASATLTPEGCAVRFMGLADPADAASDARSIASFELSARV